MNPYMELNMFNRHICKDSPQIMQAKFFNPSAIQGVLSKFWDSLLFYVIDRKYSDPENPLYPGLKADWKITPLLYYIIACFSAKVHEIGVKN